MMASGTYDVVIANIVADVLVMIASDLKKILKPSGTLILSGILDKYEDKVLQKYRDFAHIERIAQDEWVTLIRITSYNVCYTKLLRAGAKKQDYSAVF